MNNGSNPDQSGGGFSLVELLVVLIIIGILAAIAVPYFLDQVRKAGESEGKLVTGTVNRTQQAYFAEKRTFSSDLSLLGLGIKSESNHYSYLIQGSSWTAVVNLASPRNAAALKAFAGGVQTNRLPNSEASTLSQLCQSVKPSSANVGGIGFSPIGSSAGPQCQNGFEKVFQ